MHGSCSVSIAALVSLANTPPQPCRASESVVCTAFGVPLSIERRALLVESLVSTYSMLIRQLSVLRSSVHDICGQKTVVCFRRSGVRWMLLAVAGCLGPCYCASVLCCWSRLWAGFRSWSVPFGVSRYFLPAAPLPSIASVTIEI